MPTPAATVSADELRDALTAEVDGEVRFDAGSRAAYSTDASNYRQVPIGVVIPRTIDAAVTAVSVCARLDVPMFSRGGGTSLAGQATNAAVVLDWSKYCDRLLDVDVGARTCVVEPGIVLDTLNQRLRSTGLRFGPEPATHDHCTLGGMIGNNSCGATAQRTGKVVDNVSRLEILLYDGTRLWVGETADAEYDRILAQGGSIAELYRSLRDMNLAEIRTGYPKIPRRVSGYNLDSLLPENGFHIARALVGSESTCVTVLRAELQLLPVLSQRSLVVLGYPDIYQAAAAVQQVLQVSDPIALEGMDDALIHAERRKHINTDALPELPDGAGWLLAQFGADTAQAAAQQAHDLVGALARTPQAPTISVLDDPAREDALWQVREAGLGTAARSPGTRDAWPGWEDSAVAPDRLADYLRDLHALCERSGYGRPALYGHFGQACIHTRIPFDLDTAEGTTASRRFLEQAADLVVSYGGSLSGEHGDGQGRGELLPRMFSPALIEAFAGFKAIFDPRNRMNPGKITAPRALDTDLRLGPHWHPRTHGQLQFAYPEDDGSFSRAVGRCVGVGKCRHDTGGVMCPSYMATREEEHSTRGRARLLFEMLNGHPDSPITDGWRSDAVKDSLDLCLSCKGCKGDCPVNVDMATYKAEFLAHYYAGRQWRRHRSDLSMGWLPALLHASDTLHASPLINAVTGAPGLHRAAITAAGIDPRRQIPRLAATTLRDWYRLRGPRGVGHRGPVLLWPDTFTNYLSPAVGQAAIGLLEDAGWRVLLPPPGLCCGLTWISTGQLSTAKRILRRTVNALAAHVRVGGLIVGLEPSCTTVFRSDAAELFPGDHDVVRLQRQTLTLAELLTERNPGWQPPTVGRQAVVQRHCHQHAVLGADADATLMERAGIRADVFDSGCCGLAGNFGFTAGHYDISQACAERVLFPALRTAPPDALILADGFSCRTQISQSDIATRPIHLAQALHAALTSNDP